MSKSLTEMTDTQLHSEIFNCDAFDQDDIASELFLELWTRYKNLKDKDEPGIKANKNAP